MSNYHPLWSAPTPAELEKGSKAIVIAQSLSNKSQREKEYIDALANFFDNWQKVDHATRVLAFEKAMESIYNKYPKDVDASVFYALALNAAADPTDKTYRRQRKAGDILMALYPDYPNHPGVIHYIIHTYDNPELASLALPAARKYALVAASSAHAQHMPSHIFTRLGLWNEGIQSNLASVESARCYAQSTGIKGHWDEELHGLDYLVYSYLQRGDNKLAKEQYDYLMAMKEVTPVNFKVAYAFAAIPSRYLLENRMWKEAASLEPQKQVIAWEKYPWQNAIIHFTRALGNVHMNNLEAARAELKELNILRDTLVNQKNAYNANQVQIQANAAEAWILFKEGKNDDALQLMTKAATMEESTQKHPVTPGEVLPARELLADMLLEMNQPAKAMEAYEADLKGHPNRFNGLYGAALAAEKSGQREKANSYYRQLSTISDSVQSDRREIANARYFLQNK